jgi:hypothetical protein
MCEAIQMPGAPAQEGWIASSQGLLAMTAVLFWATVSLKAADYAEFIIGRAFARPVG